MYLDRELKLGLSLGTSLSLTLILVPNLSSISTHPKHNLNPNFNPEVSPGLTRPYIKANLILTLTLVSSLPRR